MTKAGFTHHETYTRPPRTESETNTEWLFVRHRYPGAAETAGLGL